MTSSARKRNWQTNKTREKIRDSIKLGHVIRRFENHVLKNEGEEGYVKLSMSQIAAGKSLMDRTLPVLSSAEIVETHPEKGLQEAQDKLIQMLGPELAKALTTKDGTKALLDILKTQDQQVSKTPEKTPEVTHEQPEQTQ